MSWTGGSCPGCNVLKAVGTGFVRQGFQQPPEIDNNPTGCPPITAGINIIPMVTPSCGTKYDFEFSGNAVAGATYEWNFGDGAFPRTSTLLNPSNVAYGSVGTKIITVTIRKGNCQNSKARTITVAAGQIGFAATPTKVIDVICQGGQSGSILLSVIGGTGVKTFRWSNGATTQDLVNVAAGRYSVTATDGAGCIFSADTTIKQPLKPLSFSDSLRNETCTGLADGAINFKTTGGTAPYTYLWSNGATTQSINALAAGRYSVNVLDSNKCKLDTAFTLVVSCKRQAANGLYDVITPNGDGKNDTWTVNNIDKYPNNEMFIYNRWGQLVYSAKKYANTWGGTTSDGKELPSAAYFYVIKLNNDAQEVWKGSITIVR